MHTTTTGHGRFIKHSYLLLKNSFSNASKINLNFYVNFPGKKVRKVCNNGFFSRYDFTVYFFKVSVWFSNPTVCKLGLNIRTWKSWAIEWWDIYLAHKLYHGLLFLVSSVHRHLRFHQWAKRSPCPLQLSS